MTFEQKTEIGYCSFISAAFANSIFAARISCAAYIIPMIAVPTGAGLRGDTHRGE
jgi:hypothetical protein